MTALGQGRESIKEAVDLTAQILARAGLEAWEVFASAGQGLRVSATGGEVETLTRSEEAGISLRAFKKQRAGSAFSLDLGRPALEKAVAQAVALMDLSTPEPALSLASPGQEIPAVDCFDQTLPAVPQAEKISLVLDLEKRALAFDRRVAKVRRAGFSESASAAWLRNSLGLDLFKQKTSCQAEVLVLAQADGQTEFGYDLTAATAWESLELEGLAERAAERAVGLLGAQKAKSGRFPAIIDNLAAAELLSVLAPALLAENVQKGKSLLARRLGEKVFSAAVDLVDDGLRPGGLGTAPFDDEGTPQGMVALVSAGVLQGYLYDRLSAAREGRPSTGHGRRPNLKSPPGGGVNNLFVKPGKPSQRALLEQIQDGFFITDLMGLHTADPVSGDFSLGASGFWISQGRAERPVKGAAVSGNLLDLYQKVAAVGSDLRFLGRVGSPSLALEALEVAG